MLFERLRASDTRFDGEALFLVFWKPEEAVCILASNATDMTADAPAKTVLTVSPDCASLRMTADSLRTAPWAAPEWVAWREWQGQGFSMHYPSNWIADTRLAQQPYCQPGTGIRCVGAFMFRNEDVEGIWTVIAKARPPDKSLSKLAIEAWDEGGKAAPSPGWVVAEPVTLDDGTEAVQILSTWTAGDQSGILTSVSVATEKEHYMLAGTAGGKPDAIFAVSELLSAMMRSFHLTGK